MQTLLQVQTVSITQYRHYTKYNDDDDEGASTVGWGRGPGHPPAHISTGMSGPCDLWSVICQFHRSVSCSELKNFAVVRPHIFSSSFFFAQPFYFLQANWKFRHFSNLFLLYIFTSLMKTFIVSCLIFSLLLYYYI